jgi:hypothetical protein
LIYEPEAQAFEMYDLRVDPLEAHDVFEMIGDRLPDDWVSTLRRVAEQAIDGRGASGSPAPDRLEGLRALGYVDDP